MMSRHVHTNGIRVHYLESGTRELTLVLMPGLTANAHSFDGPVAAGLADHIRVLALDLRGRGETDQPDTYTWPITRPMCWGSSTLWSSTGSSSAGTRLGGLFTYHLAAAYPERGVAASY